MIKCSFLKVSLFFLCILPGVVHSSDAPSKTTGWKFGKIVSGVFLAAWTAKNAREYLIAHDWNSTEALKSLASNIWEGGKGHIFAPVRTVETIAGMVLPTTVDWTLKGEARRLVAMGVAIGIPMGLALLEGKMEESGNDAIGSLKKYYDTTVSDGFHCCRRHTQEFLNPVSQVAAASLIMGTMPVVIDSVVSSEHPLTVGLEATIVVGAAYLFSQSYLCKKHHNHLLLQERNDALEKEADELYQKISGINKERVEVARKFIDLVPEMDPDLEDRSFAYA
jgi:hypothetical protein